MSERDVTIYNEKMFCFTSYSGIVGLSRFRYRVGKSDERIPVGPTAEAPGIRRIPARVRRHSDGRRYVQGASETARGGRRKGGAGRRDHGHERFVAGRAVT